MGIAKASASLSAVRADLDMPAGGMTERAVLNKGNKTAPPLSLASLKGNVIGQQLLVDKTVWNGNNAYTPKRSEGSAHYYIARQGDVFVQSGNRVCCLATSGGAGGGDRGTEYRGYGKVQESGTHRLTGKVFTRWSTSYLNGECHVYVIANRNGYLSGVNDAVLTHEQTSGLGSGEKALSFDFSLSTGTPYITLVFRYVWKDGGAVGETFQHDFYDFKLVKL